MGHVIVEKVCNVLGVISPHNKAPTKHNKAPTRTLQRRYVNFGRRFGLRDITALPGLQFSVHAECGALKTVGANE